MAKKKTTTRKTGKARKKAGKSSSQSIRVLLAALFLTGFLILCLVVLGHLRQTWHSRSKPLPVPVAKAPSIGDVQLELDSALWRAGISFDLLQINSEPDFLRYEVRAPRPKRRVFNQLEKRLARLSTGLHLESDRTDGGVAIRYDKQLLFLIYFNPANSVEPLAKRPRLAIIMDDLGHELRTARKLLDIPLHVTFAILPYPSQAVSVSRLAHRHGREVMLHIPMEPHGYPAINPGPEALLHTMNGDDLQAQLNAWLDLFPEAVGGNNHMGSLLTEQPDSMTAVLQVMRQRGLFFVDSRTSAASVAVSEARRQGVPVTLRDVFLDNVREVPLIAREIKKLAGVARRRGSAVGICHPYPETLEALRQEAEVLREQGIDVVPVSQLLPSEYQRTVGKGG